MGKKKDLKIQWGKKGTTSNIFFNKQNQIDWFMAFI